MMTMTDEQVVEATKGISDEELAAKVLRTCSDFL